MCFSNVKRAFVPHVFGRWRPKACPGPGTFSVENVSATRMHGKITKIRVARFRSRPADLLQVIRFRYLKRVPVYIPVIRFRCPKSDPVYRFRSCYRTFCKKAVSSPLSLFPLKHGRGHAKIPDRAKVPDHAKVADHAKVHTRFVFDLCPVSRGGRGSIDSSRNSGKVLD